MSFIYPARLGLIETRKCIIFFTFWRLINVATTRLGPGHQDSHLSASNVDKKWKTFLKHFFLEGMAHILWGNTIFPFPHAVRGLAREVHIHHHWLLLLLVKQILRSRFFLNERNFFLPALHTKHTHTTSAQKHREQIYKIKQHWTPTIPPIACDCYLV